MIRMTDRLLDASFEIATLPHTVSSSSNAHGCTALFADTPSRHPIFLAIAFTEAILVTPLGALSVVICAILSKFFLGETLTFFVSKSRGGAWRSRARFANSQFPPCASKGWIGCTLCIIGAVILALNAPETQSVSTIPAFQHLFLSPGFLVWAGLCIVASLFLAFWAAPRYGKKNMFVYIGICSLIGGLSVSTLQGLGAAIVTSIRGNNQFKHWFLYVALVFVVITLLTEINYLNKALELFNTSMVTPTYYIMFTSATLISSFILYQGLKSSAVSLITMVLGFLVTCLGITLLQMSKIDPKKLDGSLDRRSTMLMQASKSFTEDTEKNEITNMEEPGMDALRGGFGAVGSIIRARSVSRRLSNASSLSNLQWQSRSRATSNVHPMEQLPEGMPRYSLSDNPMPEDASERISMHTRGSTPNTPQRPRAKSTLKFDDQDLIHQYDRKGHGGGIHMMRAHDSLNVPGQQSPGAGGTGNKGWILRQESTGDTSPGIRVVESPVEEKHSFFDARPFKSFRKSSADNGSSSAHDPSQHPGAHRFISSPEVPLSREPLSADIVDNARSPTEPSSRSGGFPRPSSFANILERFGHHGSDDHHQDDRPKAPSRKNSAQHLATDDDMRRGGAHRGTRDYPHLQKAEKAREAEERRALVDRTSASDDDDDEVKRSTSPEDDGEAGDNDTPTPTNLRRLPNLPDLRDSQYPPRGGLR